MALNVDDDLDEIRLIRETMEHSGYTNLDSLEYDNLIRLQKRQKALENGNVIDFIDDTEKVYDDILENLRTTKATLQKSKEYDDYDLLRSSTLNSPDYIDKRSIYFILDSIMNTLRTDKPVDSTKIYSELMALPGVDKVALDLHYGDVLNYIETLEPVVRSTLSKELKYSEQQKKKRWSVAKQLLAKTDEELATIKSASEKTYLRQIYKTSNGKFYTICPICGEKVFLEMPVLSMILFPTERDISINVLPSPILCKNNHALLLLDYEYVQLSKFLLQGSGDAAARKSAITGFTRGSENFCRGASFIRICPTIYEVEEALQYLIAEVAEDDITAQTLDLAEKKDIYAIDDNDYHSAVLQFYARLKAIRGKSHAVCGKSDNALSSGSMLANTSEKGGVTNIPPDIAHDENKMSYREVAVYMTQCLSLDYEVEKNKAIFSFLYYLQENPYYQRVFNQEIVWCYKDYAVLLEQMKVDFQLLPKDVLVELMVLHNHFNPSNPVMEDSPAERLRLQQNLQKFLPEIKKIITELQQERDIAFKRLSDCKEQLAFVKILKLSNYHLRELNAYLWDEQIAEFVFEIADRMIINNYAGDFCTYWQRLALVTKSNLRINLLETSYLVHAKNSIFNAMKKLFDETADKTVSSKLTADTFDICFKLDPSMQAVLHDCYSYFKAYDYYSFCQSILEVLPSTNLYFGTEYGYLFEKLCYEVNKRSVDVLNKSSTEFYLQDFTPEELTGVDTSELIANRYVLRRLPDESVHAYVERFKQVRSENAFNAVNSYDKMQLFAGLEEFFQIISTFSLVYDIEYESYIQSMFMVTLINFLVKNFPKSTCAELLGVSKENLAFIENDVASLEILQMDFMASETFCRIFNGIYFTSVADKMENIWENYTNVIIKASKSLNKQLCGYNPYSLLTELLAEEYYKLADDGEPIYDKNEVLFEISEFGKEDPKVLEIVN